MTNLTDFRKTVETGVDPRLTTISLTFENHALNANDTRKSTNQLPEFHTEQKVGRAVLI